MAQIKVVGNAVVFQSAMKLEDLVKIQKYKSDALSVKGGEDGKEILFSVIPVPGCMGEVNASEVVFGQKANDGLATVTAILPVIPEDEAELKEVLADKLGAALTYMNELEAKLPDVLKQVNEERNAVMEAIEIG